jgi:hypothetical protein
LGDRLAFKDAILAEVTTIDNAYGEGEDGIPRALTRLACIATRRFLLGLKQYYDLAWRPALP